MSRSRTLTREKVVVVSAELVNRAGNIEQVTLKEIARTLNIRVPSLYNHVKGQAGLRQALRLFALQRLMQLFHEAIAGKTGKEALLATAHAYRAFAHANPGIYPLILEAGPDETGDEINRIKSDILTLFTLILGAYGLDKDDAHHAVRGLRSLLHGFVSLELARGFALPLDIDESFNHLLNLYISGITR